MPEATSIHDCWNKIGVWGDGKCPELKEHIHCRNCPVYSAAATRLLNGELPSNYTDAWTNLVAKERVVAEPDSHSVMIFCIGSEWLALSTKIFKEVAELKTIHSLPHRRGGHVLGIVNIRGELLICVSLTQALKLEKPVGSDRNKKTIAHDRLLVIHDEGNRLVFPVDEVGGIHHFSPREVKEIPTTLAGAIATHTTGIIPWRNRSVGFLDAPLLFYTLNKGLS